MSAESICCSKCNGDMVQGPPLSSRRPVPKAVHDAERLHSRSPRRSRGRIHTGVPHDTLINCLASGQPENSKGINTLGPELVPSYA
jgi:hypothetical protein